MEWSGGGARYVMGVQKLKKGVLEMPGEGARRSAQHSGPLGYETRSGCWAKSRQMAERLVVSTMMDMPLDQRVASPFPGLQRPHVVPLGFREGMPILSGAITGAITGAGIELASGNSSHVFSLCNPKRHSCVALDRPSLGDLPEYLRDRQGHKVLGYFPPWDRSLLLSQW